MYNVIIQQLIRLPPAELLLELQTKFREDFTIAKRVPTRAFSLLKVPSSAFTFKNLFWHYAKHAPKLGKLTWNQDPDAKIIRDGQVV